MRMIKKNSYLISDAKIFVEENTGLRCSINITFSEDDVLYVTSNGIPDNGTDTYPNSYNPNENKAQEYHFVLPKIPVVADDPSDLSMGPIRLAVNGVPFFHPWNAEETDAVEIETFDMCDGHPSESGAYRYHKMSSSCVFEMSDGESSPLIGLALDGFRIYGPHNSECDELTSDDLDECHDLFVDGHSQYHTTEDFPYILGCFKGVVDDRNFASVEQSSNQENMDGDQKQPLQED